MSDEKTLNLGQLIKKYWQKKILEENDFLFTNNSNDTKLYYLEYWNIILEDDGMPLISLSDWEIIGEKSFIETIPKGFFDARITSETVIYEMSQEIFEEVSLEWKKEVYMKLSLFLSNRTYKLNNVLSTIYKFNNFNKKFDEYKDSHEYIVDFFDILINVKNFILTKLEFDELVQIIWDIPFDEELEDFLKKKVDMKIPVLSWKNYIFVNTWTYIFLISGEKKQEEYVFSNSVINWMSIIENIAKKVEDRKTKQILEEIYNEYE